MRCRCHPFPSCRLLINDYGRCIFDSHIGIGVPGSPSGAFSELPPLLSHPTNLFFYPVPHLKQPESGVFSHLKAFTKFLQCLISSLSSLSSTPAPFTNKCACCLLFTRRRYRRELVELDFNRPPPLLRLVVVHPRKTDLELAARPNDGYSLVLVGVLSPWGCPGVGYGLGQRTADCSSLIASFFVMVQRTWISPSRSPTGTVQVRLLNISNMGISLKGPGWRKGFIRYRGSFGWHSSSLPIVSWLPSAATAFSTTVSGFSSSVRNFR